MSIIRQGTLPVGSLDHAITLNVQSGESHFETLTDTTPYLYRTSPQDVANMMKLKKVVGGTVAWNQLIQNGNFGSTIGWTSQTVGSTLSVADGVATITHNGTSALAPYNPALGFSSGYTPKGVIGHVYYIYMDVKSPISSNLYFGANQTVIVPSDAPVTANTWTEVQILKKMTSLTTAGNLFAYLGLNNTSAFPSGGTLQFRNINIFDLTQMFGSTIADYIYTLEQAHTGDGVAWFRKLFPKAYYSYNAGELMSVKTSAHKTVGFNQWDEEWEVGSINDSTGQNTISTGIIRSTNYIPVIPNASYYAYVGNGAAMRVFFYDASKNFISYINTGSTLFTIPSDVAYIRFRMYGAYGTTYNNDICINISSLRNGEYEPYVQHNYPLDSDLELRGIPKLDADHKLYYDGDTYASDGTVTRRYGVVDLGTLTWNSGTSGDASNKRYYAMNLASVIKKPSANSQYANMVCTKYVTDTESRGYAGTSLPCITCSASSGYVSVYGTSYTDATTFKTAMSGVYLVYELATPTTESADAYTQSQRVGATEEFVDARTVAMPVGNESEYKRLIQGE